MNKCVNNSLFLNVILTPCAWVSHTWAKDEVEYNYLLIAFQKTDCKEKFTALGMKTLAYS